MGLWLCCLHGVSCRCACRYVFMYAVHYFFAKTKMSGFFQVSCSTLLLCIHSLGYDCVSCCELCAGWCSLLIALHAILPAIFTSKDGINSGHTCHCTLSLAIAMTQTTFYFGYTLTLCLGLAIMEGALGYIGASVFVRRIFRTIKAD